MTAKLRDDDARYIKYLLYEQRHQDAKIRELEEELDEMLPSCSSSIVRFSHDEGQAEDSQPEKWTIIRNESLRAKELYSELRKRRRQKEAVTRAVECMDKTESQIVILRYYNEQSHNQVARALHMWSGKKRNPSNTYWRTHERILRKVAQAVMVERWGE